MTSNSTAPFRSWTFLFALGLVLVLMVQPSWSQEATGRIFGTITDQQGAVIQGAKVTVTNTGTQVSRETVADREGVYQVLALPIGSYRVSVEHPGFRKAVSQENRLEINQALRVDLVMEVGPTAETVQVEALTSAVETIGSTLGQSVTSRPLINLPLNGRNMLTLALLQPGVTETNPGSPGLFSVAGARADSVTFLLDGGNNNNLLNNLFVYNPNPDTVAEFRLLTSNYSAEYGRNGGGIVSVVTKSGTNDFHGSAFEFVRNEDFNANSFFNNRDKLPREILKRNQFGVTAGGPVLIPKIVNGKDKLFFFAGYQGQRLVRQETTAAVTVFTPAELQGDFSLSNATRDGPDRGVVRFLQANPFFQSNAAQAARGIIDPTRINSVAQKYISNKLVPTSATGELKSQGGRTDDFDELTWKVDVVPSSKDRIGITLGSARFPTLLPFSAVNVSGYPILGNNHRYFGNITYTRVFSPTLLNELRFTAQRINTLQAQPGRKLPTPAELGIGVTPDNATGPTRLTFDRGESVGFSPQGPTSLVNNTYVWSDTVSWQRGRHNYRFGFNFSPYQNNTVYDFYVDGNFYFSGLPANGGIGSGNDFADFLLGLPDEYLQFGEAPSDIRSKSFYGFAQDEWRVAKGLTLTFGLRYEYSQPKIDTRGRAFSLKLGQKSTVFTKAPVGLLFPGDRGAPFGANFPDKNDWAPRFGFAWDPKNNGKMSLRGGFGIFYDILKGEDNLQFNGQAPFFGFSDLTFDELSRNPSVEVNYMTQPYRAAGVTNPFPSRPPAKDIDFDDNGFLPFGGGGVYFVDPHLRTPYTYHYNLSLQREIVHNLTAEASYVGSSSHKLTALTDANPFILGTTRRLFNVQPGNDNFSFSYLDEFRNIANANYNSLEVSLLKRVSTTRFFGTSYFNLSYSYGHGIDASSGFRNRNSRVPYYNWKQFRAATDFDIQHRIAFSGGWDLPFDRAWASGPRRLTQGWSLYPIVTYRSGFPLDVYAGLSRRRTRPGPSGAGDPNLVRANLVGSSVVTFDPKAPRRLNDQTGNFYFDPANFSRAGLDATCLPCATNPALRTYGTLPRNAFRGPARTNFDLAVGKTTPLVSERLAMELRVEFFNILNTAQFAIAPTSFASSANPTTTISSGLFGQITDTYDPRIIQLAVRFTF